MRHGMMAAALVAVAGAAFAQAPVPTETARLGKAQVTLHVQPFLTAQELATLLKESYDRWGPIVKKIGFTADS